MVTVFFQNKTFLKHTSAIVYIYDAHCIPFNKNKKIYKRLIKKSFLNILHTVLLPRVAFRFDILHHSLEG